MIDSIQKPDDQQISFPSLYGMKVRFISRVTNVNKKINFTVWANDMFYLYYKHDLFYRVSHNF